MWKMGWTGTNIVSTRVVAVERERSEWIWYILEEKLTGLTIYWGEGNFWFKST